MYNQNPGTELPSLSGLWAKKYVAKLKEQDKLLSHPSGAQLRVDVAKGLKEMLRPVSAQAWNKTEALLAHEIRRHQIDSELIDPWAIAKDVHQVYEKAVSAYTDDISPERLSVRVAPGIGRIRERYTAADPRVIGFVSMQFHYCGQMLADQAPVSEQAKLAAYFKVIDDHLYMPLQRAYDAAAEYPYDHPRLQTVRGLLPYSSKIAKHIVNRVNQLYPAYKSYSGRLGSELVRTSSVRDVEMFQVYLWTCVLEQNIAALVHKHCELGAIER
ncbi:MAG: hypothetical protein AAFW75_00005 [Cyanobacteria bacterium J06636_16]